MCTPSSTIKAEADVALDAILLLCGLVVLKKREEEQRYRHIDEKSKYTRI